MPEVVYSQICFACLCLARSLTNAYLFIKSVTWMRQKQLLAGYLAYGRIDVLEVGAINLLMTSLCIAGFWFVACSSVDTVLLAHVWSCCIKLTQ